MLLLDNSQETGKAETHTVAFGKLKSIKCHLMV